MFVSENSLKVPPSAPKKAKPQSIVHFSEKKALGARWDLENPLSAITEQLLKRKPDEIDDFSVKKLRKPWQEMKKPAIEDGEIELNGEKYPIALLKSGNFHTIYTFASEKPLVIDFVPIPTEKVVLRYPKVILNPIEGSRIYFEDFRVFDELAQMGMPLPKIYARPDTSSASLWIIEKCQEVGKRDDDVMRFVKKWLTEFAIFDKVVPDFEARNLMRTEKGEIVVVDANPPEKNDFVFHMEANLRHWSENNQEILDWLMGDFPNKTRAILFKMDTTL